MIKVKVEVQYFTGCPNSQEMIERVRNAVKQTSFEIEYSEILVETPEEAEKIKFRGSPTLIIEGEDFENLPEQENGNLSCRYYANGLPETKHILSKIEKKGSN